MNSAIEILNRLGEHFLNFAWPMLWQSSLLIALVFALDLSLARKIRASVRHALWLVVLVKLLLPPTLALPTGAAWWLFPAKPPVKDVPAKRHYVVTYENASPLPAFAQESVPINIPFAEPPPPKLHGAGWSMLAASGMSAALLVWLLCRWWQLARKVRGADTPEKLGEVLQHARGRAGLQPGIRLKLVDGTMSPAVCGLFRPVILLPRTLAEKLTAEQLRAVLLHEAIHIRRKDLWVNCAQALLQVAYWWHPLVWVANARIRRVREEAVDDAVMLALDADAEIYAPTLLEVARQTLQRPLLSLGLVGILESRSALRQRIERLLAFRPPRKAGLTLASLCGILAFSAVALPMGEAPARVEKDMAAVPAKDAGQADDLVRDGKVLYELGKFDRAKEIFEAALALNQDNARASYYLRLINEERMHRGESQKVAGREKIIAKLDHIHLHLVSFDGLSLKEVARQLTEMAIQNDPEKIGVPISTVTNSVSSQRENINSVVIRIPSLTDVQLADVLDAVVLVADKPIKYSIQDDGVVFAPKSAGSPQLFMRTFRVDPTTFYSALESVKMRVLGGAQPGSGSVAHNFADRKGTNNITDPSTLARTFFATLGVNISNPPGKSVFFNNRLGVLFVKATEDDLDTIERALQVLDQTPSQVHLKARFIEVPQGDNTYLGFDWYLGQFLGSGFISDTTEFPDAAKTGILTNPNFQVVLHTLQSRTGVETLGEPEIITLSGRQTKMKASTLKSYIGDFPPYHNGDPFHPDHLHYIGDFPPYHIGDPLHPEHN